MADETEHGEPEKPRRRRRRKPPQAEVAPASEAAPSDLEDKPESDEIEPTPADVEAGEATEVVLEADDEAEGEPAADQPEGEPELEESVPAGEPEAPVGPVAEQAKPARRRRRGAARSPAEAEKPVRPAPARRRRREVPAGPPPLVQAKAKYVRTSARKARLVCDNIRGKTVPEARAILALTPRAVARDWSKLLESAVANAEHNHELVGEDLYVQAVHADEGPTLKRFRPRAMGRATRIRKRTSHLTILLTPKE
jgi:ribosomal protein L22